MTGRAPADHGGALVVQERGGQGIRRLRRLTELMRTAPAEIAAVTHWLSCTTVVVTSELVVVVCLPSHPVMTMTKSTLSRPP